MAEILKFRFVPDAHIEDCKFFYEDDSEVETNYSLDLMRLLSNVCTSKNSRDSILQIENEALEHFLEGKDYKIHIMLCNGFNMGAMMEKVEQCCDSEMLFIFLGGPGANVATLPVFPARKAQLCVRLIEGLGRDFEILMLY